MNNYTLGHFETNSEIERRIKWALKSGRLTYGPFSVKMEEKVSKMIGVNHTVLCNSGTSALVVALQALKQSRGWQDGDEVICPAVTFVATINAVLHNNLKPVLVDVSGWDFNINSDLIEAAITPRTRCIIPVHLFGMPVNESIYDMAKEHNLAVVEDCCEAFGAMVGTKQVGSFGDIGCFSTYVGHHIVAGVGGFCTTDDPDLHLLLRSLVNHGIDTTQLPLGKRNEPSHLGRIFNFTSIGHSFRITELEAILAIDALNRWDSALEQRQLNAAMMNYLLAEDERIRVQFSMERYLNSRMVYPVLGLDILNTDMIAYLNRCGIEARMMMPLTNQPCYDFDEDAFVEAKQVNRHGFYVGCHEKLSEENMKFIARCILNYKEE